MSKISEEKVMKKVFKVQDLDCAHCAAKMEAAIREIPGVQKATLSFMTQRLTVECEEDKLEAIMDEAVKRCKKIEPDAVIVR